MNSPFRTGFMLVAGMCLGYVTVVGVCIIVGTIGAALAAKQLSK